jgi:hypothetical protein
MAWWLTARSLDTNTSLPRSSQPIDAAGLRASDCDRMLEVLMPPHGRWREHVLATSLATQALQPGTTGRHQMKWVPHLSSHDGPWRVQPEG